MKMTKYPCECILVKSFKILETMTKPFYEEFIKLDTR